MAEKTTQELERIYTIPLRAVKSSPRNHQADRAIRHVRAFLQKHMKAEDIWIDASVNEHLWSHGMYQVPSKIRVRARKFDDGVVEVSLPETDVKASIRGEIKERQEKKEKGKEKKEEEKAGEEKAEEKKEEPAAAGEKPAAEKPAEPPAKEETVPSPPKKESKTGAGETAKATEAKPAPKPEKKA